MLDEPSDSCCTRKGLNWLREVEQPFSAAVELFIRCFVDTTKTSGRSEDSPVSRDCLCAVQPPPRSVQLRETLQELGEGLGVRVFLIRAAASLLPSCSARVT